jgi:hypothetical protein
MTTRRKWRHDQAAKTGQLQVPKFKPGESGNSAGRPVGSRNRASVLCDRIADDQVAGVLNEVLRRARRGDMRAAAIVLSRCWPARKARVRFPMPTVTSTGDLPQALAAVTEAISAGILSPDEAAACAHVLNVQAHAIEVADLDRRMREIERRLADEAARSA